MRFLLFDGNTNNTFHKEWLSMKKAFTRGAGVLMPISALPSPYGIGTLGEAA